MSVNTTAKSSDRGKKSSPSQKNQLNKSTISAVKMKTETSKGGRKSSSPVSTIERYLIKAPATGGLKSADNNNVCNSKTKSSSDDEIKEKQRENAENSERSVNLNEPTKAEVTKEISPEPEIIDVDDSIPDSELSCAAKNNDKEQKNLGASDQGLKNVNGEKQEELAKTNISSNGSQEEQQTQDTHSKLESQADDGDSTDDIQSENESEKQNTQEYDIDSGGDARAYVDYKEEDFNTDSDFDKSDLETESKGSGTEQQKEQTRSNTSGSKRKSTTMGSFFCSKRRRQENCQGSSSEEETERPWRPRSSSRDQRARHPYPLRSPRVTELKRHWSDQDTQQYRAGYPDKPDNPDLNGNADFYRGKIPSRPDGSFIDDFHKHWWHDHDRLESRHGYIQWLFPIRESGMNLQAQELQPHESEIIRNDPEAMRRFKKSYEMMLYFYGIRLVDRDTGEVERAENWQPRFRHLNHSTHNFLRITRILKCLGEMGLEHFKLPFLKLMLHEAATTRKLDRTWESCTNFWIGTVKDNQQRERLEKLAKKLGRGR